MNPIVIVGYSGHAFVVTDTARAAGHQVLGYCDVAKKAADPCSLTYLGKESDYFSDERQERYFISIGDNLTRRLVDSKLTTKARATDAIVHPNSTLGFGVEVAPLSLICAGAVVQTLVSIGRAVVVNTGARVDHECILGDFSHVAPGAIITGRVTVGVGALVGANATVLPGLTIGDGAVLGAGSVLLTDLPAGQTWVGNPARPIKSNER